MGLLLFVWTKLRMLPLPVTRNHPRSRKISQTFSFLTVVVLLFPCPFPSSPVTNSKRIIITGVVDQLIKGEDPVCNEPMEPCDVKPDQALCKYIDQVDVYQMDAPLSIGPVFARHIGHRLYRGEYYATQSDAHVSYTLNWDVDIIEQMEATHNEMAVLSTYLTDVQDSIDPQGHSLRNTRPIMCNTYYEGGSQGLHLRHGSQPERRPSIHGTPQLQPWWAAGYSFSRGHFVVNVPYDPYQPMVSYDCA